MVQVTDNTEFIIGIDFDNEKTSASFYSQYFGKFLPIN